MDFKYLWNLWGDADAQYHRADHSLKFLHILQNFEIFHGRIWGQGYVIDDFLWWCDGDDDINIKMSL